MKQSKQVKEKTDFWEREGKKVQSGKLAKRSQRLCYSQVLQLTFYFDILISLNNRDYTGDVGRTER